MNQFWKKFCEIRSYVASKNFQIRLRKRWCVLKTRVKSFAEKKLSPIIKTFARKPAKDKMPMPTAKKVDPLPLRGVDGLKLKFEPLPLPKGLRGIDRRSVWTR